MNSNKAKLLERKIELIKEREQEIDEHLEKLRKAELEADNVVDSYFSRHLNLSEQKELLELRRIDLYHESHLKIIDSLIDMLKLFVTVTASFLVALMSVPQLPGNWYQIMLVFLGSYIALIFLFVRGEEYAKVCGEGKDIDHPGNWNQEETD